MTDKENQEFLRIYQSILQDIEKWNGEEPIEKFLAKILKKRLLIEDEEKAESISKEIISGMIEYKKAKNLLDNNSQFFDAIISKLSKQDKEVILKETWDIFESVKRSINNEKQR